MITICILVLLLIIIYLLTNKKYSENFNSTCYDTQLACIQDCVEIYTFIPSGTNKWWFYNGEFISSDKQPQGNTLTFTRYPNNVVEINCLTKTVLPIKGDGFLYFSLTDGIWKKGNTTLAEPPAFLSSITTDNFDLGTYTGIKLTGRFPIYIQENGSVWGFAGLGKNIASPVPDNKINGNMYSNCCPKLFFYINYSGSIHAGGGTAYTIYPFVGRIQGGNE